MADKKKFEKPQMELIQLKSKVGLLAGSCVINCDDWTAGECPTHD